MSNQLMTQIDKKKINDVKEMFQKIKKNSEFEFTFFSKCNKDLTKEIYINAIKYLKYISTAKNFDLQHTTSLDIAFTDVSISYRITILGQTNIDDFIKQAKDLSSNSLVYKYGLNGVKKQKNGMSMMTKLRNKENVIDIEEFNIRAKMFEEAQLTIDNTNLQEIYTKSVSNINDIVFRYKDRISLIVHNINNEKVSIDLTTVKMSKDLNVLYKQNSTYELEIEIATYTPKQELLNMAYEYSEKLIKIIQQSNFIVSTLTKEKVISYYLEKENSKDKKTPNVRKPVSLEVQHVVENLTDRYAVTDKADGDRYLLLIFEGCVYLINMNMMVKDTGIVIPEKFTKYNGTILDGELIYLQEKNRHIYLAFDCLQIGDTDMRREEKFMTRQKKMEELINTIFVFEGQVGYKQNEMKLGKEFNLDNVCKYHGEEIKRNMKNLNHDIEINKKFLLIRKKYFIDVLGALRWEIFKYSSLMWFLYTEDSSIKCPYLLDGLIYHPLEQQYVTKIEESKYVEYKWKPPTKNSIDFYILFKRDEQNRILTVYDNSNSKTSIFAPYKICNLYVWSKSSKGKDIPILFNPDKELHEAYLYIIDGEVRDQEGNILYDDTVVEFVYNTDNAIPLKFKWTPLRTRYDKTEKVQKYKTMYGNFNTTAQKVWRSIENPVLMAHFEELGRGNKQNNMFYDNVMKDLTKKIDHSTIISIAKENKYFQETSKLAKSMRNFHNWIKSNIIYTYCHPMYSGRHLSVLDVACGRGADLMRFYYTSVQYYVGIDIDKDTLLSASDGALSRYKKYVVKHPNAPKMYFVHGDYGLNITVDDQRRALGEMSIENKKLIEKYFDNSGTTFDVINCQFAIHYFLKNSITWKNFKNNVDKHLAKGGYLLVTTFDAEKVVEKLTNNPHLTSYYTSKGGTKKILYEIIKKYGDLEQPIKEGHPIDIHMAWIFAEGRYYTEYLVDRNFIKKDLYDDCKLEIIETDLLINRFNSDKKFLVESSKYEENEKTRKFFHDVAEYYDQTEINTACYMYSEITRYYVFRKLL